jgi:hypothetical protein
MLHRFALKPRVALADFAPQGTGVRLRAKLPRTFPYPGVAHVVGLQFLLTVVVAPSETGEPLGISVWRGTGPSGMASRRTSRATRPAGDAWRQVASFTLAGYSSPCPVSISATTLPLGGRLARLDPPSGSRKEAGIGQRPRHVTMQVAGGVFGNSLASMRKASGRPDTTGLSRRHGMG